MAGKFFNRSGMNDLKRMQEMANSIQRREGLQNHPSILVKCLCPNPNCGGWHEIEMNKFIPTEEECSEILKRHNKTKKDKSISKNIEPIEEVKENIVEKCELRKFYEILGEETLSQMCRASECDHGTIVNSIYCKKHHFEMIQKIPCPFTD